MTIFYLPYYQIIVAYARLVVQPVSVKKRSAREANIWEFDGNIPNQWEIDKLRLLGRRVKARTQGTLLLKDAGSL